MYDIELAPVARIGGAVNPALGDRRRRRGEENRDRISQAFIEMVAEGMVAPTAAEVARRANVGRRSVFRHFRDMDALYREMTQHASRLAHRALSGAGTAHDIASRVAEMIHARCRAYEQLMPFEIAAQAHGHEHGPSGHAPEEAEGPSLAITRWTERYELFVELPAPTSNKPVPYHAHVTRLSDFAAVTEGTF